MTALQKLQIRQSEIREKINTLLGLETRTEEQDGELVKLTAEGTKIEPEIRAAIVASPDPEENQIVETADAETRELQRLTERANAGAIILAVTEKRNCIGAELELQQHHKLAENQIPLDMLRVEQRAAGLTTAPTNVGTSQAEIVQPVFANGAGAYLGNYSPDRGRRRFGFPGFVHSPGCGRAAQRLIGRTGNR